MKRYKKGKKVETTTVWNNGMGDVIPKGSIVEIIGFEGNMYRVLYKGFEAVYEKEWLKPYVESVELINKNKLILHLNDYALQEAPCSGKGCHKVYDTIMNCIKAIEEEPIAIVKPLVRGEWIFLGEREWVCSECGEPNLGYNEKQYPANYGYNYCDMCGADLRRVVEIPEFRPNIDMFGCIAWIKTDYNEAIHMYKVIGRIRTNSWCDIPIKHDSKPYIHECDDNLEDVLLVLHCGIGEDNGRIVRVALKDCERVENTIYKQIIRRLKKFDDPIYEDEYGNCVANIDSVIAIVSEEAGITCGE